MNSRDQILQSIKSCKGASSTFERIDVDALRFADKKAQFIQVLQSIGGKVIEIDSETVLIEYLKQEEALGKNVVSVNGNQQLQLSKEQLYDVDIACLRGSVAVAENGAVWVTEKQMGNRILPFSCQQLIIVVQESSIVHNMHQAYDLIDILEDGYGVFIAGPSKTADIEQSLVIGAHGPVEMIVFMIKTK